jgi:glutamate dehydrogenase (NADP+)
VSKKTPNLDTFMAQVRQDNPGQPEFHQAVLEVCKPIFTFIKDKPRYHEYQILRRITEPDRIVSFRVCWENDQGSIEVNRGWRIQNNSAIGPYKGGLRFHPSVNESILKFLAFEQTFKNSLTGLPLGGGKGGANFDPKGRSDHEVMRFCQSFMNELYRHIGDDIDVPAGDIGVGAREIGFLYGQWKRLTTLHTGVLTGKGLPYGGSLIRQEATGYGCSYFMQEMLATRGDAIEGKICLVSGSGNVAQYAVQKITALGGKVVTMSDSDGFIHDPDGIDAEKLAWVMELKNVQRGRLSTYPSVFRKARYHAGKRPWGVPAQLVFPCATQNEISHQDALTLLANGCIGVSEGANMPSELAAIDTFLAARILFAPAKAANAGGVAVSGLEMSQNSARMRWKEETLQELLRQIMQDIHGRCLQYGGTRDRKFTNYVTGANIAGFVTVADAMLAYGIV